MEKKIEYDRLLHIAKKMHLWIFLHTGDEEAVYKELGITYGSLRQFRSTNRVYIFVKLGDEKE